MQGASCVEVLPHRRQQVALLSAVVGALGEEGMREGLVGSRARGRIDSEAARDEVPRGIRHAAPERRGLKAVVSYEDGLHLLEVRVAVEGGVSAEQEVRDDAD